MIKAYIGKSYAHPDKFLWNVQDQDEKGRIIVHQTASGVTVERIQSGFAETSGLAKCFIDRYKKEWAEFDKSLEKEG